MVGPLIGTLGGVLEQASQARDLVSADPANLDPFRRAARIGVRQFCRGVAGNPLGHASFGGAGLITSWVCEPLYDEPGNDPGNPNPPPPFEGGQCPVQYQAFLLTISDEGTSPANGQPDSGTGLGPLSIIQISGPNSVGFRVVSASGGTVVQRSVNTPANNLRYQVSFQRLDGLPDSCGNPPSPPPIPPTVGNPYDWGDIEPVDGIPVRTYEPTINVPINIDIGGLNVPISFGNSNPDTFSPPAVRSNPPATSDGSSDQGGNYDFGDPPTGQEWVGFSYAVSVPGNVFGSIPNSFPFTALPRVIGNARLKYSPANAGGIFPGENYQIRELGGSVIRQDPGLIVTGCYAQVTFPAVLTVFPLSANKPPES